MNSATAWIDGASRGNPGPSGIGIVIQDERGKTLLEISEYIGENLTNNQAEYHALVRALETSRERGIDEVEIRSDSQLLVRQMNGRYRVDSENLKDLHRRASELESGFKGVTYKHVSRDKNEAADRLANESINRKGP